MQPASMQEFDESIGTVSHVAASSDRHTRFITTMVNSEKAFPTPATMRVRNVEVALERNHTQADQGSDMNVLSIGMAKNLGFELLSFNDIGFRGLTMRTADHKETLLLNWVWLEIDLASIWRRIRCFVAPSVFPSASSTEEPLSLLLGIPWLYSVNAILSIRESKTEIGDPTLGEQVREVEGPELVFCNEHDILMYPKSASRQL